MQKFYTVFSRILLLIICQAIFQTSYSQELIHHEKGTIYILRHAEKGTGNDPALSEDGFKRSGELARLLKSKGWEVDQIYVSQYKRTQQTADSVRIWQNADTFHYKADVTGDGIAEVISKNKSKKDKDILIVGHSNTVPVILKRFGINDYPKDLPDNEYDNLFIIRFKDGKPSVSLIKYGASSTGASTGSRMLQ